MDHAITDNFFANFFPVKQKGACTSSKVPIIHFSVHTRVKTCVFKKKILGDYSDNFLLIFVPVRVSKNISIFLKEPEECLAHDLWGVDM